MAVRGLAAAVALVVAGCQSSTSAAPAEPAPDAAAGPLAPKCATPKTDCAGTCVDLRLDRESCGACGKRCASADVCSESQCGRDCKGGTVKCGNQCAETAVDPLNCGACGKKCGLGQGCAGGLCKCDGVGLSTCGGTCVDTLADAAHCGGCDRPCAAGKECIAGACMGPVSEWRLDGSLADTYGKNNGVADGPVAYDDLSWSAAGGKALRLDGASSVVVAAPVGLPLGVSPRTLEAWVRGNGVQPDPTYNGLVSYGARVANQGQLLSVQANRWVSSASWANDLLQVQGGRGVYAFSHAAFTWDGTRRRLYIDGEEVASDVPAPFDTALGELRIGSTDTPGRRWTGWIDDVRIYDYARPAARLRASANTDAVYRFSAGRETEDAGPNRTTVGTKSASGLGSALDRNAELNGAITFDGAPSTSFRVGPVQALGKVNRPYSFMIWLAPTASTGVLAHVSSGSDGVGWCVAMLGLLDGKPVANSWTSPLSTATADEAVVLEEWVHLATTWSAAGGLKLYVGGVLRKTVPQATFAASDTPMFVTLGSHAAGAACAGAAFGPFKGAMDDFKVFDRELSAAEVVAAMKD